MTASTPPDLASGWRRRVGLFADAPFAIYWAGGLLSNTGTWLQAVAASVYVYQLTQSVFMVGVLNFASFLPIVLFSVFGGAQADRRDRRVIVIVTSVVAGIIALGLAAATFAGRADVLLVIVVGFLLNTVYAVTKPSITALLPELVPKDRLDEAVALNTLQFIIGQLLGPLLATLVLAVAGAAEAFLINALTFIGPILAMAYLIRRGIGAHARAADLEAPADGPPSAGPSGVFAYIRANGWIGQMLITVVCASAAMEVARTTAPALAAEQLRVGESGAGIIVAAQSFGSAIGVFMFVMLRNRLPTGLVATSGMAIQAVGLVGLAFSSSLLLASASVMLVGLGFSMAFPVPTGALQKDVDPSYRGRVMSVHQVAHLGVRPFAALAVGAIAAGLGLATASLFTIVILPVGIAAVRRGLGHRRAQEEASVVPAT